MNADIRIGVVGAGANTVSRHIPGLQALPGVRIIGVGNRSPQSSQRVADRFGIERTYADWREAVDDPDTNAIVIGTWPCLHARVTIAALEAGKHVMCEARMARDADEAHAMLQAAEDHPELAAQVVPSPFTLEFDRTIRRLLAEGYVGNLQTIRLEASGADFLDTASPLTWRQDFEKSGLNTLTLGIWYEALMRWVGEAAQVSAMGRVLVPVRPDGAGGAVAIRVPDHLDVLARMGCGAQANMRFSSALGPASNPGVDLVGDAGALRLAAGKLLGARRGETAFSELPVPQNERGKWRVEEEFVGAIRGEEPIRLTTFEDGVKYMEFTEAVARSMAQKRTVELPLTLD